MENKEEIVVRLKLLLMATRAGSNIQDLKLNEATRKSVVSSTMKSCFRKMPHQSMQTAILYGTPPKRWKNNGTPSLQGGGCLPSPERYRPTSTLSLSGSFVSSSLFPKA